MIFYWLLSGLIVGLLANGARVGWAAHHSEVPYSALLTLSISTVAALAGGWAGTWLFGAFFSVPVAIWLSIIVVIML